MFRIENKFIVFAGWVKKYQKDIHIPSNSGGYRLVACHDTGHGETLHVIESKEDLEQAKAWEGGVVLGYFNIGNQANR